jgi:hypothetical protein
MSSEGTHSARGIEPAGRLLAAESRKLRGDGTVNIPEEILNGLDIDPESDEMYPTVFGYSNGTLTVQFDLG